MNTQNILNALESGGAEKLHVLADFDLTLTLAWRKFRSIISLLRSGEYLTENYAPRAHALFDHYHPIEIDHTIALEEKKLLMSEWWQKHFELMIECGLTRTDTESILEKSNLELRPLVRETLQLLSENNIPVVIISASAIGESIPFFLKKNDCNFPNISFVCNRFIWDEKGVARDVWQPIVHSYNKDETVLRDFPAVFTQIHNRKNVILLGDSLGDPGMVTGFEYDNLLKIGFLNPGSEHMSEQYQKAYDILIENDGDFSLVNKTIYSIVSA